MQPRTKGSKVVRAPAQASAGATCWKIFPAFAVIALAASAAYANSFSTPFFFDDTLAITNNPSIRHLHTALLPTGAETAGAIGRPLANFSFAVNYALGGLNPWGYHAVNLLIHILAAWLLFGVARRTLGSAPLAARFGAAAVPLAFIIALLWAVHPLLTESVTSVVQRTESLMSLFYLLTLYCFIRSVDAPKPRRWQIAAVIACLFGMASKEAMATAPLLVLLYDRTFVAGTFRSAFDRRRKFYLALAGTWMLLAALVLSTHGRAGTAGFDLGVSWWAYALKQCQALAAYLRLAFWPTPLVFDYGTDVVASPQAVWPQIVLLALLALGTLYALWRKPALGFVGAGFFLILAPSSSILPLTTQTMAEHRMYLPLAAVVALVVLAVYSCFGRRTVAAFAALAAGLGMMTYARNSDYRSATAMWADTIEKRPGNARAHYNYGCALLAEDRNSHALGEFLLVLYIDPGYSAARSNIGDIFAKLGQLDEAAEIFQTVLRAHPEDAHTRVNLGMVHVEKGDLPQAVTAFRLALQNDPNETRALANLGAVLVQLGRPDEALPYLEKLVQLEPGIAEAYFRFGNALLAADRFPPAATQYHEALRLQPSFAEAHNNLGSALVKQGKLAEALPHYREAVRLRPDYADARRNLAALEAAIQAGANR